MNMRKKYMVGNWKMNQTKGEIEAFFRGLDNFHPKMDAWVAPQFVHLPMVLDLAKKIKTAPGPAVQVGAQNCSHLDAGAFTGDVSPAALKELGVHFVILGHSERRAFFQESHQILNTKTLLALGHQLKVIFCVGESLAQRQAQQTQKVVQEQLDLGLKNIPSGQKANLLIAYEPVWAIGTGQVASPEQAQEVHQFIRNHLSQHHGFDANSLTILYGGSVNPKNVAGLLEQKDIDGGLVGGASLKVADFQALCLA